MNIGQQINGRRYARLGRGRCWQAAAIASALLLGMSSVTLAQTADRVWADCVLSTGTITGLLNDVGGIASNNAGSKEVAFVVVYSISNENNGQPVGTRDFTGPVICRNNTLVSIAGTQQTTSTGTVDVLDAASAFLLRYQDDELRTRLCHTVDSNTDCFTISKPAP